MSEDEAKAAVEKALIRCKATLVALNSNAPVDDLPAEAARVMGELNQAQRSLELLYTKAHGFAESAYSLRAENEALWNCMVTLAEAGAPEKRLSAVRAMLAGTAPAL